VNLHLRSLHRNHQKKMAPAPPRSTAAERQRVMEENRQDAEAAQKIVNDQKEKARLEEENKKLKVLLEKAKNVPDPVPESSRPKSATKRRLSNSVRRVKAVYFCISFHKI
jgi:hypothetical protein